MTATAIPVAEQKDTKPHPSRFRVGAVFTPNASLSTKIFYGIIITEIILVFMGWMIGPGVFPTPVEVLAQYPSLLSEGLIGNLITSLLLGVGAILLSTIISLSLAYLSVVPPVNPIVNLLSKLRFLSLVGMGIFFHAFVGGGHAMKVAMLTFGMSVFFLSAMYTAVHQVPTSRLDYVRTMRASEWRVVFEEQILGTIGTAFDVLIDTAAMSWLMLTAVEGIVREEGGIGVMLLSENKHYNIAGIIAVQIVFLLAGMVQDFVLRTMKVWFAPHSILAFKKS